MRIVLKFSLALNITLVMFGQNSHVLEKKLRELWQNKDETKAKLEKLEKHSAVWGEEGYVGRNLKPLYTTVFTTHMWFTPFYNLFEAPVEAVRLVLAYPLAPVTVPILTVVGIANCIAHVQEDAQKLQECEDTLQKIEEEIKKTDEDIRIAELKELHEQCVQE